MIKTDIIINITNDMALVLTQYQLEKLKETLENNLKKVEINILTDEKEKQQIKETNDKYINIFLMLQYTNVWLSSKAVNVIRNLSLIEALAPIARLLPIE